MSDQAPVDQSRDPSLEAILDLHAELMKDSIHVMLPGKIVSYDATKQQAVVQPLVKSRRLAEDGVTRVVEDLPPIHNVPVEFCGPARGRVTWPVASGDICEVRFASSSLARWVVMSAGSTVDPGDDRRHDLSDAVCFVGLHSPASPPTDAPVDAVVIHVSGGVKVKLGSSGASHPVPQGDNLQSALNDFLDALNTYAAAIAPIADPVLGHPATVALQSAIVALQGASYLSGVSRTD
jgi:hypothetical protein